MYPKEEIPRTFECLQVMGSYGRWVIKGTNKYLLVNKADTLNLDNERDSRFVPAGT